MYGGSSKLGRGGAAARGGGGAKRSHSSFPLPSRRSSGPSGGRLSRGGSASAGGPHNRPSGPAGSGGSSAPTCAEETFSLIPGKKPPDFAMIIRLTPELVEEIRRAESQGETPRIKFDANAKNANGNVIDVGGKEFRFIWSRERADLCDIYEERQSGEDGNGLLVESGSAWRKLNVQRVLDESTTNHVKMRSEEAERKLKARKAICLDPANPSMKSQMKALAAVETNPWKKFNQKKEPPLKKQKVELPQGGPPKPAYKSGLASTTIAKSRLSASPLPSPHEQFGAPASPFGPIKTAKSHLNVEEIMPSQVTNKETVASFEKEIPSKAVGAAHKGNFGAKPKDLQSLLITLLKENPKGMSLKALEIAVGDPNSAKKIEPVIKRIATLQAPGRYFLKPGMDESFRKPPSDCGSSPDENRHQTPAPEADQKPTPEDKYDQTPARESSFDGKVPAAGLEERAELNKVVDELNSSEPIHIQQQSPNLGGERRISDNSDGTAGSSSSGSDSDSESDSGDSKSGSHRRSRSPSPAGSGSGSSSDSESDVSSNSKEGSDEDVDIMTSDDDNEPKNKLQASESGFSILPNHWGSPDGIAVQSGLDEKQDDLVEIEKDSPDDGPDAERPSVPSSIPHEDSKKHVEETKPISPERNESQDCQNIIEKVFEDEENTVKERISKGKSRGGSDSNHFDDKSKHAKRLNAENLSQPPVFGGRDARFSESPRSLSPGGISEFGMLKGCNQATPVKSRSDFHQLGQKSSDQSTRATHDTMERSDIHADILGRGGNEDGYVNEKKAPSNLKEGSEGGKYLVPSDAHYQKPNDVAGKFKVSGQVSNSRIGLSPINNRSGVDRSPIVNGRGSILQRELSDLELGELREALPVEPPPKKQFERKSPFKQLENKFSASGNMNLDSSRGKSFGKSTLDSVKPSPPNLNSGVRGNLDSLNRKKTPEHVVQSQVQNVSRGDRSEVSRGPGSYPTKDSQRQTYNTAVEMTDGHRDSALTEGNNINSDRKSWNSYSDENAFSYFKYEKDKPELKGPIKDFAQYKEYVQEYRDKYESYCTLNKILESDRIEFLKLGKDLELAKDRDMGRYRTILGQLMESYQQCGERHKRLKKIFIVLHEELKHLKQKITDFALPLTKD